MISIRGKAAKAHARPVAVEGGDPVKVVHADGFPATIPAGWIEHAKERVTASAGDVIRAEDRLWQVTRTQIGPTGKLTYQFRVDVKEGGERILYEVLFDENEAEIFACDPSGPVTAGDLVRVDRPSLPKKGREGVAKDSHPQTYSLVILPNGSLAYAGKSLPDSRATHETLARAKRLAAR